MCVFPSCVQLQAQIDWTLKVEACLQSSSSKDQLSSLLQTWQGYLEELAGLAISSDIPAVQQCVLTALLTLDVHARDVIHSLVINDVAAESDFDWIRLVSL